jgi:hypothetical protein
MVTSLPGSNKKTCRYCFSEYLVLSEFFTSATRFARGRSSIRTSQRTRWERATLVRRRFARRKRDILAASNELSLGAKKGDADAGTGLGYIARSVVGSIRTTPCRLARPRGHLGTSLVCSPGHGSLDESMACGRAFRFGDMAWFHCPGAGPTASRCTGRGTAASTHT